MDLEIRCKRISQIEEDDHVFVVQLEEVWVANLLRQIGKSEILERMKDLDTPSRFYAPEEWLKS